MTVGFREAPSEVGVARLDDGVLDAMPARYKGRSPRLIGLSWSQSSTAVIAQTRDKAGDDPVAAGDLAGQLLLRLAPTLGVRPVQVPARPSGVRRQTLGVEP